MSPTRLRTRPSRSLVRLLTAAMVTAFSLLTLAGCERYELDRQMEALCKKDGGVKIYETVTLPAREYEAIWKYAAVARSPADYYGPEYRAVSTREVLVGKNAKAETGAGQLARLYSAIYRRSDGRLLGEEVQYRRDGGDPFTLGFQPSSAACPHIDPGVAKAIFIKGE